MGEYNQLDGRVLGQQGRQIALEIAVSISTIHNNRKGFTIRLEDLDNARITLAHVKKCEFRLAQAGVTSHESYEKRGQT
jgi:hypothetical protein